MLKGAVDCVLRILYLVFVTTYKYDVNIKYFFYCQLLTHKSLAINLQSHAITPSQPTPVYFLECNWTMRADYIK